MKVYPEVFILFPPFFGVKKSLLTLNYIRLKIYMQVGQQHPDEWEKSKMSSPMKIFTSRTIFPLNEVKSRWKILKITDLANGNEFFMSIPRSTLGQIVKINNLSCANFPPIGWPPFFLLAIKYFRTQFSPLSAHYSPSNCINCWRNLLNWPIGSTFFYLWFVYLIVIKIDTQETRPQRLRTFCQDDEMATDGSVLENLSLDSSCVCSVGEMIVWRRCEGDVKIIDRSGWLGGRRHFVNRELRDLRSKIAGSLLHTSVSCFIDKAGRQPPVDSRFCQYCCCNKCFERRQQRKGPESKSAGDWLWMNIYNFHFLLSFVYGELLIFGMKNTT